MSNAVSTTLKIVNQNPDISDTSLNGVNAVINKNTGEIFIKTNNQWVGQITKTSPIADGIAVNTQNIVDILGNDSGVSLYQFNNTSDDTGYKYNAEAIDITYETGKFDNCAIFNGLSSVVNLPNFNNIANQDTISISLWFKTTQTNTGVGLISLRGSSAINFVLYLNKNGAGDIGLDIGTSSGSKNVGTSSNNYNDGNWHHLALSIDYTNQAYKVYVDKNLVINGTDTNITKNVIGVDKFQIGANYNNSFFNGNIDQFRVINQVLSDDDVSVLYDEQTLGSTLGIVDIFGDGSGVALYQLDGNANDTGGNYDGTANNVTYDIGKFNQAAVFNGNNSYIIMGDWLSNVSSSGQLSFSFWQKTTSTADMTIWSTNNLTSANSLLVSASNFQYWDKNANKYLINFPNSYSDGEWHHFVCIVDTINNAQIVYQDGTLVANNTISAGSSILNSSDMSLGKRSSSSEYYFNGSIDQLRIFSRALTNSEVQQLYNES